jgi:hypothetical protein
MKKPPHAYKVHYYDFVNVLIKMTEDRYPLSWIDMRYCA